MSSMENQKGYFQLPITHIDKKMPVSDHIKDDIDLNEAGNGKSLYNKIFLNKSYYSQQTSELWSEYYTYDKQFLKDTQRLLSKSIHSHNDEISWWDELKGDGEFDQKYNFVQLSFFRFLNKNSTFLGILSTYRFASPLIALVYPLFFLFVPLIILRYNRIAISFNQYVSLLKMMIQQNSVVQLFTNFSIKNWRNTVYLLFSAFMYVFNIYQNIVSSISFYMNMKSINARVVELVHYIENTLQTMKSFKSHCTKLSSYKDFIVNMDKHYVVLEEGLQTFKCITPYSWNFHNISHMGYSLKVLYYLHYSDEFNSALRYSFGFSGYLQNLQDIQSNIKDKHINAVKFGKTTQFTGAYYPIFKGGKHVKNTYSIKKNLIISGPNASGKTTLIKTTLFNILLSQQIGYGFFASGKVKIYKYIHSYLNIPDTSDRDSLFQAEARRCREIISALNEDKDGSHFCIFDELYSGTNPYEANASAFAFIRYMLKYNIDFMLTTHFVELCKNLQNTDNVQNIQMDIQIINDDIKYLYRLKKGISTHKGGVKVLKQLNYPKEIISDTECYLNESD